MNKMNYYGAMTQFGQIQYTKDTATNFKKPEWPVM